MRLPVLILGFSPFCEVFVYSIGSDSGLAHCEDDRSGAGDDVSIFVNAGDRGSHSFPVKNDIAPLSCLLCGGLLSAECFSWYIV